MRHLIAVIAGAFSICCEQSLFAQEAAAEPPKAIQAEEVNLGRPVDFAKDILPILDQNCVACHNVAINESRFVAEDVESLLKGGKRGAAIVPGKPDESLLFHLASRGKLPAMPPLPNEMDAKALTPKELGTLRQWILEGAKTSGSGTMRQVEFHPLPAGRHAIFSVAVSPWGRLAASGRANQVLLYDLATGEEIARLTDPALEPLQYEGRPMYPGGAAHRDFVQALAFSPDGTLLASAGYRVVKLWKQTPASAKLPLDPSQPVTAVAASRDGKLAAVATADNTIRLVDLAENKPGPVLSGHSGTVTGLEFSPDGTKLFSASLDQSLRAWNTADGALAGRIDTPAAVNDLVLNKEGTQIISAGADNLIRVWNLQAAAPAQLSAAEAPVLAAAVSPDRKWLAIGSEDGKVALVDLATGQPARTLAGHSGAVQAVAFSGNNARLATGAADKSIRVWDVAAGTQVAAHTESTAPITAVALHPNGEQVVSAAADANTATVWKLDAAAGTLASERALEGHGKPVSDLVYAPDGNSVFTASEDGTVRRFQIADGKQQFAANHGAAVHDIDLSPNGQLLASAGENNQVRIWNAGNGGNGPRPSLDGFDAPVKSVAFSGDNNRVIAGTASNQVRVDSLQSGNIEQFFSEHTGPVNALAVMGEQGDRVVSASADKTVRTWPLAAVSQIAGHGQPVTSVDLMLPAGQQIVSGSQDGTVRIWNLANGQQVRSMNHGGAVAAVAARADGQAVASAGANNMAKLWKADNGQQIAELKGDVSRRREVARQSEGQRIANGLQNQANSVATAADKSVKDGEAALKTAQEALTKATEALAEPQKKLDETRTQLEAAKTELAAKTDDEALQKKVAEAQKAVDEAAAKLKQATDARDAADRSAKLAEESLNRDKARLEQANRDKEAAAARVAEAKQALEAAQKADGEAHKPVRALAFSPDGKLLVAGAEDNLLHVWSGSDGRPLEVREGHQGALASVAFAGPRTVVSGSADQTAIAWNLVPQWTLAGRLGVKPETPLDLASSPFVDRVLALDFSPDGKRLATGGGDPSRSGELMLWNTADQTLVREIADAHSDTVLGVEFSRDGKFLLSGGTDKFAKVFEVETGKHVRSFEGHTHHVMDVSWKADGTQLVTAGADNQIKIWNTETGEQIRTISNYPKQVTSIQYVGDGDTIASCGGDASVRFHRAANGQNFRNFGGSPDYVYAVAAARDVETAINPQTNRDCDVIVAGGEDGTLRVWKAQDGQALFTFAPPKPEETAQASAQE